MKRISFFPMSNSKTKLKALSLLFLVSVCFLIINTAKAQTKKPNIIFILTDDQRAEVGIVGHDGGFDAFIG